MDFIRMYRRENMKTTTRSLYLKLTAVALALTLGATVYAETPREELVHAYRLLKWANSNYDGHRVKAMKEIEVAGKALGLDLEGGGSAHERQWKSDEQLTEARRLLREVRDKLEARDRDRVAAHVERALKETDAALTVK
jgi:hypothetical protein